MSNFMPETKILITGAGRGIGFALTQHFLKNYSCKIYAISRNISSLIPLAEKYPGLIPLAFDLEKLDTEESRLFSLVSSSTSEIDILINNAGLLIKKPFQEISPSEIRRMMEINAVVPGLLINLLLPLIRKSAHPHIVNIGSMGGFQGSAKFPGLHYYSASKGALAILTECLAEELKPEGIAVNCLALGAVQTEMLSEAFPEYSAPVTAAGMAEFIAEFAWKGHACMNGKILPVSLSVP